MGTSTSKSSTRRDKQGTFEEENQKFIDTVIKFCEELGNEFSKDPYYFYSEWTLRRVMESHKQMIDRKIENYKMDAAFHGISFDDEKKKEKRKPDYAAMERGVMISRMKRGLM